jgi:hypothetical protein
MSRCTLLVAGAMLSLLSACSIDPSDERPGLRLSGTAVSEPVEDWSFVQEIPEIFVETQTAYRLPHSVTIWCVSVGGQLYVAASNPEGKRWVANVGRDSNVRLGVAGKVYERRLEPIEDPGTIQGLERAYSTKYGYEDDGEAVFAAYWRVVERS